MNKWILIICSIAFICFVIYDRTEDIDEPVETFVDEVANTQEDEEPNPENQGTVCSQCNGSGQEICYRCSGKGQIVCVGCSGTGVHPFLNQVCPACGGTCVNQCFICKGLGSMTCRFCAGQGIIIPHSPTPSPNITIDTDDDNQDNKSGGDSDYGYYDCPTCYGSGTCQTCNGKGYTGNPYEGGDPMFCPNCRNHNGKCSVCNGSGKKYGRIK